MLHISAIGQLHFTFLGILKGDPAKGLFYPFKPQSPLPLMAYCDVDWATCKGTRCSVTGYSVFLGDCFISWKSKKQVTMSRKISGRI